MKAKITTTYAARLSTSIVIGVIVFIPVMCTEAAAQSAEDARDTQDYPRKQVRIIDGYAAGGSTDLMARVIAQRLSNRFGTPVIVENRPGAGSNLGAEMVAKSEPDGTTMFIGAIYTLAASSFLYPKLGYDVMKDFAYITLTAEGSYVLVATPSLPAKSIPQLVALAKSQPRQFSYGSPGVGSGPHLTGELFKSRAGVEILHVPFRGAAPILNAVVGNEIQLGISSVAGALPMIKAGRIIPLAVSSAKRAQALPDLPTIAESGFPGYDITVWYGLLAPAASPVRVIKLLNVEIGKILQSPEVRATFSTSGLEATSSTPERFREVMRESLSISGKIIKDSAIKF